MGDHIIGIRRNLKSNSDQTACAQQTVGVVSPDQSGKIDVVIAIRAVNWAKDRVPSRRQKETRLDACGRDRHSVARLMASAATSPVRAQALEKRAGKVDAPSGRAVGLRRAGAV